MSRPALQPALAPIQWTPRTLSPGVMWPVQEVVHSISPRPRIRMGLAVPTFTLYTFMACSAQNSTYQCLLHYILFLAYAFNFMYLQIPSECYILYCDLSTSCLVAPMKCIHAGLSKFPHFFTGIVYTYFGHDKGTILNIDSVLLNTLWPLVYKLLKCTAIKGVWFCVIQ